MWEPRRPTTLQASTACYRDSFIFIVVVVVVVVVVVIIIITAKSVIIFNEMYSENAVFIIYK
jgi:hypothetical protein